MSTFWIEDLKELSELLPILNERLEIAPNSDYFTEESATIEIDAHRKDSNWEVLVITAEKSAEKNGSGWRQRITLEWNMDYQSVDEVVYYLKKLLGINYE